MAYGTVRTVVVRMILLSADAKDPSAISPSAVLVVSISLFEDVDYAD